MPKTYCLNCVAEANPETMVNGVQHCSGCGRNCGFFYGGEDALLLKIAQASLGNGWKHLAMNCLNKQIAVDHN